MTSARIVSLNGGVYWMKEEAEMKTELGKRLLRLREEAIANGMQLLSEDEVLALRQDNLDTKSLELAAKLLSNPRDTGCPPFQVADLPCTCPECWIAYLRQKAKEAA